MWKWGDIPLSYCAEIMPVISYVIFSDWGELFISYSVQLLANLVSSNEIWEHWNVLDINLDILLSYESSLYWIRMNRTMFRIEENKELSFYIIQLTHSRHPGFLSP